jgi:GAF domain-containing protein
MSTWDSLWNQLAAVLPPRVPAGPGTDVAVALDQTRRRILELLIVGTLVLGGIAVIPAEIEAFSQSPIDWRNAGVFAGSYAVIVAVYMARRARFGLRAGIFAAIWYLFGLASALLYGLELDAGITMFGFVIFTYILFGERPALSALLLSVLTLSAIALLTSQGLLVTQPKYAPGGATAYLFVGCLVFLLSVGVTLIASTEIERDTKLLIEESAALSSRLEEERAGLEARVVERTRALEASFSVSRRISTIVDPDALVSSVIDAIQDAFGYEGVQVHLVSPKGDRLMPDGNGSGEARVTEWHQGLAAEAAAAREVKLRRGRASAPEAYMTEAAIPILLGDQLLGILHIRCARVGVFDAEALEALQAVSSQLAVALQNARTFNQAQSKAALERHLNAINRAIRDTTDAERAYQVAVREIGHAMHEESAKVRLIRVERKSSAAGAGPLTNKGRDHVAAS